MSELSMSNAPYSSRLENGTWSFPANATDLNFAREQDSKDPLRKFRNEFCIPSKAELKDPHPEAKSVSEQNDPSDPSIYLCGNSLGLQPKRTRGLLSEELSIWATRGVTGHFDHPLSRPWVSAAEQLQQHMSAIVGASPSEVAVMGSLTDNIHLLMASFYRPTGQRTKIIIEGKAFPSDHYAMASQIEWHGLDPNKELVLIEPRSGEYTVTTQEILDVIEKHKDTTAVIFLSGVQYYTGQLFEMEKITKYAKERGIMVGWDLAHAVGNVEVHLHDWGVDFAAWCTYKYLSSGPGGMAGIFVHSSHDSERRHRLAGWWGHDPESRFRMENTFNPAKGAAGYMLSNPSIMSLTALRSSLSVFAETSMAALRTKSMHLTAYLNHLLDEMFPKPNPYFRIITPADPHQRGAQLSLLFKDGIMLPVFNRLMDQGIVVDERKPDVIRVAPLPMYNGWEDVYNFVCKLKEAIEETEKRGGTKEEVEVMRDAQRKGPTSP
ncbi:pyridoxal phosphate-dependent transferase [Pyronema omphalodes]|nr:pyridoxal phosphate-dependent transferase [Pyronema omphalodes]